MWGSCGHRPRLVITTQGIDLSTACLLILLLLSLSKTASCTWIMWTHWSADWELLFIALGHYWRRDYPLLFCACVLESVLLSSLSQHTLPLAHLRSAMAAQRRMRTHGYSEHICCNLHNQRGPNDWLHWLPSICNYFPIVYFLAFYSFKRNSIIIALFNVKVSKSGGCVAPIAVLSLSVSMNTPPERTLFLWLMLNNSLLGYL